MPKPPPGFVDVKLQGLGVIVPGVPDGIAILRTKTPSTVHSSKNTGFVLAFDVFVGLPPMNGLRSSPRRTITRLPGPNGTVAAEAVAEGDAVSEGETVLLTVMLGVIQGEVDAELVEEGEGVVVAEQADTERTLTEPAGPVVVDSAPLFGHVAEPGLYVAHAGL